jgi:hypothetical protein
VVVGPEPVQLATSAPCAAGLVVKASAANSGAVYLGPWEEVSAGAGGGNDGFELGPGESVSLELNDARLVWLVADRPEQNICWLGV